MPPRAICCDAPSRKPLIDFLSVWDLRPALESDGVGLDEAVLPGVQGVLGSAAPAEHGLLGGRQHEGPRGNGLSCNRPEVMSS